MRRTCYLAIHCRKILIKSTIKRNKKYLAEHDGDSKEAPHVDGFGVGGFGEAVRYLLVEGVEHQQRCQGHHYLQRQ